MTDDIPRREFLKTVPAAALAVGTGAAGLPGLRARDLARGAPVRILPLTSTSEVFVPPRGGAFMKFSFDFPEPSVEFAGLRFGFLVFTHENAYGLDPARLTATGEGETLEVRATGLVWAGGQARVPGSLVARLRGSADDVTCDVEVELDRPIKSVTTIVRGVPRGRISSAGGRPFDPHDDEILFGYPFGAGDLFGGNTAWGLSTPFVTVQVNDAEFVSLASLDDRVRAKRFYFQPGPEAYRVELVHEVEGWTEQRRVRVPGWRAWRTPTLEDATDAHYSHLERTYRIPRWDARSDVPDWLRSTALVVQLHGMHYTGYVFNDYERMLEILRWISTRIPGERVLAFLPAWDGRYYWDYPTYRAADRLGGEAGFRRLVTESHQLGIRVMPMFGANAANRGRPEFAQMRNAATRRIDGEAFDLDWVDWDNDRHQEGWLAYMNLGVPSWRRWLTDRIADTIDRYGVDAYFLDIVAGWIDNPQADMHEGTRLLVSELRERYPSVLACGEFHYDALLAFIPLYQVGLGAGRRYARSFSHLSHPAPGRGSSGVHESGFSRWNPDTLGLSDGTIPTLSVVDDTFIAHRDEMEAVIARATTRAGA